jgi:ABC-type glutathione transport system ATPase component
VPLLSLRDIDFSYSRSFWEARFSRDNRKPFAMRGINFELYENESIAVVGESGCGKSTLGKLIIGQLRPQKGSIEWQGERLQYDAIQQHRKQVQMLWQNPDASLNPGMKVSEQIQEAILLRRGEKLSSKNRADVKCEMCEYLALVKLLGKEECYPETLSGGEQHRLSVARCLALNPKLIVADEPFTGLDSSLANLMKNIFMAERVKGVTFIFILHDLRIAQQICNRVVVINDGRIIEIDEVDKIFDHSLSHNPYTQNLINASEALSKYQE